MMIIKLIGILILAYLVMNAPAIFRTIRTIWTGVSQVKEQMRDFKEQSEYESQGNVKYKRTKEGNKKIIPRDEGDYVEYEEVRE